MGRGLLTALVAWGVLYVIGEAAARLLLGQRAAVRIPSAMRLPLGVAATTCLLEAAGYFLSIRVAAGLLLVPVVYGAVRLSERRPEGRGANRGDLAVTVSSLFALGIGLAPVFVAGRFTAAALTNNDGTYYITVADRLERLPFGFAYTNVPFDQCLNERVLHIWNWRLGTPNLMAAVSAVSGLGSQGALAVVTALLFATLPPVIIGVTRSILGRSKPWRELLVGLIGACSAAPAFVGYQHMTGHLAACALFPASATAVFGALRRGGVRRMAHAGLFLGASVAFFADAASVLVLVVFAALLGNVLPPNRASPVRTIGRVGLLGIVTALIAPFTIGRTAIALYRTLSGIQEPLPPGARLSDLLFPQRGWLARSFVDDLATASGVDPWPPWPASAPPTLQTWITWMATVSGVVLFAVGASKLRRRERTFAGLLGAAFLLTLGLLHIRYLRGKVLLTAAGFVIPLCAVGVASLRSRWQSGLLALPLLTGELVAIGTMVRPSRWKVVDRPAHDALVPELSRVPGRSLLAFDGLGAPSDAVLDTHRAYRAAFLAHLMPVQPGLDGGFYAPLRCPTTPRPGVLPPRGYALQRVSSETLTHGKTLAAWDAFRLLEVDLTNPLGFIAAWAPTHGFMAAEHEANGGVFRWAEPEAAGTLQVVGAAACATLKGELRLTDGTAEVAVRVEEDIVHSGFVVKDWAPFETRPFSIDRPVSVSFRTVRSVGAPPDDAHALAMRNLSLTAAPRCGTVVRRSPSNEAVQLPMVLDGSVELSVTPPAATRCSTVSVEVSAETGGTLKIGVDDGPPISHYVGRHRESFAAPLLVGAGSRKLRLGADGGASRHWQLTDVLVAPSSCP